MKLAIVAGIIGVALMGMVGYGYYVFCEKHAKSVLTDISQSVDGQFDDSGCLKDCYRGVEICDWIEHYYPLGAVLPTWHPFAKQHEETRVAQINRIHAKLVKKFGADYGYEWSQWKRCIYNEMSKSNGK